MKAVARETIRGQDTKEFLEDVVEEAIRGDTGPLLKETELDDYVRLTRWRALDSTWSWKKISVRSWRGPTAETMWLVLLDHIKERIAQQITNVAKHFSRRSVERVVENSTKTGAVRRLDLKYSKTSKIVLEDAEQSLHGASSILFLCQCFVILKRTCRCGESDSSWINFKEDLWTDRGSHRSTSRRAVVTHHFAHWQLCRLRCNIKYNHPDSCEDVGDSSESVFSIVLQKCCEDATTNSNHDGDDVRDKRHEHVPVDCWAQNVKLCCSCLPSWRSVSDSGPNDSKTDRDSKTLFTDRTVDDLDIMSRQVPKICTQRVQEADTSETLQRHCSRTVKVLS